MCRSVRLALAAWFAVLGLFAQAGGGENQLQAARELLTGGHKDTAKARSLLLEIVSSGRTPVSQSSLAVAYVYLGYIEDRAGERQRAIAWFEKALAVQGGAPGFLAVAP
jgi:tetratricopeptide (TPR) repeat protein